MEELTGIIERITFQNPDNGYTVAKLQIPKQKNLVCVVGSMPTVRPGETIRCEGIWKQHPIHGRQFEVDDYRIEAPSDMLGIRKYLSSGLIRGIGPVYAGRIVEKFGILTLEIIDQTPKRLSEIPGIGKTRIDKIEECWAAQKTIREVMIFLQSMDISPAFAQKIFKTYGQRSIDIIKENPYSLARDVFGIGFKSADKIAAKMGIEKHAPGRIDAGVEYVLSKLSEEGNVCYPVEEFLPAAQEILDVPIEAIGERLDKLQIEERIVLAPLIVEGENTKMIWLKGLFLAEVGIAREVHRLINNPSFLRDVDTPKAIEWVEKRLSIELASQQREAVSCSLGSKMQIITGGPGVNNVLDGNLKT